MSSVFEESIRNCLLEVFSNMYFLNIGQLILKCLMGYVGL